VRNRGVSQTMPFLVIPRSLLRGGFIKNAFVAQYHGVQEAASRVHDEHIGIGRVYHLFRLPEHVEQALFNSLQNKAFVDCAISTRS
jgi:hypothetical protein